MKFIKGVDMDERGLQWVERLFRNETPGYVQAVLPKPQEGDEDVRFVDIHVRHSTNRAQFVLNALARDGFMERHGEQDSTSNGLPAFRVIGFGDKVIHLEDTNSRLY